MAGVFKRNGSDKWYYKFKGADGKWHQKAGFTDKAATEAAMRNAQKKQDRIKVGIIDPLEDELTRPIADHLAEWIRFIATKETTKDQQDRLRGRVEAITEKCGIKLLPHIKAPSVADYLIPGVNLAS